ncbi:MAG TPA: YtxH domain-containing protein [Candidatus Pristimantibacillus sp.]|jgi:gas vesicle protein|nr:YtxH domain-containing protein [Candidatus Pristimantibacillus sp.]
MDKRTKRFAVGAVVAAAAGYVAGILTAPKSGKETRKDIKDTAVRGYGMAEKELKVLHTELSKLMDEAGKKATDLKGSAQKNLDKAVAGAKVAKEKARDLLSAIHEGDADDKDLDNAVKEAKKAADHLKSFLKK